MKKLSLYLLMFFSLFCLAQIKSVKPLRITKLVIDSKKTYYLNQGDSSVSIIIDTLIMRDKAELNFFNKKKVQMLVNEAIIGKNCIVTGTDGKNNGTNLALSINFKQLGSLFIALAGDAAKTGNRNFDNGNGGQLQLNYLLSGAKPQLIDRKLLNYLSVKNTAGGSVVDARTDIAILVDQVRNGTAGRPLGNLPNGRVYSGNMGKNGSTIIQVVNTLN